MSSRNCSPASGVARTQPARRKPEPRLSSPDRPGTDLVVVGDGNPDVLVLGDDVTPSFGQQEKLVDGIWMVVGGSAAITAGGAARLGGRGGVVAAGGGGAGRGVPRGARVPGEGGAPGPRARR